MDINRPLSPPPDVDSMKKELQALSRKDLQSLAKLEGVKANMSSATIIEELLRLASGASGPVPLSEDALPVVRAPGPAVLTVPPTSISQQKPKSRNTTATLQPAVIGKQAVLTSRPGTSSSTASNALSRPDTLATSYRDQAATSQTDATNKGPQQLRAARTSADVATTSASAAQSSGSRRKRWEVPDAVGTNGPREQQQLQQGLEQLKLSPADAVTARQAAPASTHTAAVAQPQKLVQAATAGQLRHDHTPPRAGKQQQQYSSSTGIPTINSSKPAVKQASCPQEQLHGHHISSVQSSAPGAAAAAAAAASQQRPHKQQIQQQPQQQLQQQQQHAVSAPLETPGGHVLHTPVRVRLQQQPSKAAAAAVTAVPRLALSQGNGTTAAAAVTPIKQRVQAFGAQAGEPAAPNATPVRGTTAAAAAAGAAAGGTAAASGLPVGLLSPRPAVMGSARRVVPTQSRVASTAAAAAAAAAGMPPPVADVTRGFIEPSYRPTGTAAAAAAAGGGGGAPPTPLQKGARRAVPVESEQQVQQEDRQLEVLVERCLRIRNPDAPQTVLQGSEPAKRWLQQHIITPLKRATPPPAAAGTAAAARSSTPSSCLAAGFCHRALLLYGPTGSGKTELVHALAGEIGANLLYVPAGDLLKSCQEQGQRLLRALFKVARRAAPSVICFDDAHRSFPADARLSSPSHPSHKMLLELTVQLQQLADMQVQLQERLQHGSTASSSSSNSSSSTLQQAQGKPKKPAWGIFSSSSSSSRQKLQDTSLDQQQQQQAEKPLVPAYQQLPGPVIVVFATRHPEALDPALLPLLPARLLLDVPCMDSREDILMAWLMSKDAAVGVQDVERLAKHTEGFSCTDLMQLCYEAAMRPVQERSHRAVCIRDFEAAFQKVKASVPAQRRMQLKAWTP